jgi:hypothetical protein
MNKELGKEMQKTGPKFSFFSPFIRAKLLFLVSWNRFNPRTKNEGRGSAGLGHHFCGRG